MRTGKLENIQYKGEDKSKNKADIEFTKHGSIKKIRFTYDQLLTKFYTNSKVKKRYIWLENLQEYVAIVYLPNGKIKNVGCMYLGYKDGYNILYDVETGIFFL